MDRCVAAQDRGQMAARSCRHRFALLDERGAHGRLQHEPAFFATGLGSRLHFEPTHTVAHVARVHAHAAIRFIVAAKKLNVRLVSGLRGRESDEPQCASMDAPERLHLRIVPILFTTQHEAWLAGETVVRHRLDAELTDEHAATSVQSPYNVLLQPGQSEQLCYCMCWYCVDS